MKRWIKFFSVMIAALVVATGSAESANAAPVTPGGDSVAAISERFEAGISMDSADYAEIVSSPGFHFAPTSEGGTPSSERVGTPLDDQTGFPVQNITAGTCQYNGVADYPHVTKNEASVHGYWVVLGGSCPSTATVTVDLQAHACSSLFGCGWITQNSDHGTYAPGSGTGRWATPHKACQNASIVGWRGQVDVDLIGWNDPSGYQYSVAQDLPCYPAP